MVIADAQIHLWAKGKPSAHHHPAPRGSEPSNQRRTETGPASRVKAPTFRNHQHEKRAGRVRLLKDNSLTA